MNIYTDASDKKGKCVYVVDNPFKEKTKVIDIGKVSNNEGEYLAIIYALKENSDKNIAIYSDSQLVINQLNHKFAIKADRLRELAQEVWKLSENRSVTFTWIPRNENKAGKVLG